MRGKSLNSGWYRIFPMGVEQRGPFRASMVLRHSTGTNEIVPAGVHRQDRFLPQDGLPLLLPHQVHGDGILHADIEHCLPFRPPFDGVLLDDSGLRVALRFADCFPVLLWGVGPKPWMLGLHSGFKGTLLNIAGKGVRSVKESLGKEALSFCHAWIGPGICADCYSRAPQDPFAAEVKSMFPKDCWEEGADGVHPDLGKMIATQLADAGVPVENITRSHICSSCDHSFCYSYRRGDVLARMWLLFEIRDSIPDGQKTAFEGRISIGNSDTGYKAFH